MINRGHLQQGSTIIIYLLIKLITTAVNYHQDCFKQMGETEVALNESKLASKT